MRDGTISEDLAEAQIRLACERTNVERSFVVECVTRWMEQEPLSLLPACAWPGLRELLQACKARGLRLGVLSDYPAEAKLEALGLRDLFDVVLCAQAPDIGVFKPHPRGIEVALQRLEAAPAETLYVGDRVDADAAAAAAAGVPCAILAPAAAKDARRTWLEIAEYAQLRALLFSPLMT
jgi:HAD superfamily hydrolase (TIGR01509 family)